MVSNRNHKSTISQAVDSFLADTARRYAAHTSAAYTQALHLFCRYLHQNFRVQCAHASIQKLQPDWALAYLAHLQETRSVETEHLYIRTVVQFYEFITEHYGVDLPIDVLNQQIIELRRTAAFSAAAAVRRDQIDARIPRRSGRPSQPMTQRARISAFAQRPGFSPDFSRYRPPRFRDLWSPACQCTRNSCELALGDSYILPLTSRAAQAVRHYLAARRKLDSTQKLSASDQLPLFARHDKRASKRVLPISRWTGGNIVDD
jgi:hypothetical protein